MSRVTTYLIGRDPRCDRRIDDPSVSRRHAEVIPAPAGRLYVTDRASSGGTFVRRGGEWTRIRQAWVEPADRIRFGGYEMGAAELAALCSGGAGAGGAGPAPPDPVPGPAPDPPAPAPDPPPPAREEKKKNLVRDRVYGDIVEAEDDRGSAE